MTAKNSDSIKGEFPDSKLRKLLCEYWLASCTSEMNSFVDSVMFADLNRLPMAVVYRDGPVIDVRNVLQLLDIEFTMHQERGSSEIVSHYPPLPDDTIPYALARVPGMIRRLVDLEILLPYQFQRSLTELGLKGKGRSWSVEAVFLPYVIFMMEYGKMTLREIVRRALKDSVGYRVEIPRSLLRSGYGGAFYEFLQKMPEVVLLYLGLSLKDPLQSETGGPSKAHEHPVNLLRTRVRESYMKLQQKQEWEIGPELAGRSDSKFPRLVKPISLRVRDVGRAASNMVYLHRHSRHAGRVSDNVRDFLLLRLKGVSECVIRDRLEFGSESKFRTWLREERIDMSAVAYKDPYRDWLKARKRLFGDSNSPSSDLKEIVDPAVLIPGQTNLNDSLLAEEHPKDRRVFMNRGKTWLVVYGGAARSVRDSVGMTYICQLLQSSGQDIHAAALRGVGIGDDDTVVLGSAGEMLDGQALREINEQISVIDKKLAKAKVNNDLGRQTLLTEKRNVLLSEVRRATGLGGKTREASSDRKRHRQAVSAAIHRALRAIKKEHESLWRHLENSLKIGEYLSYEPDQPTSWTT